MIQSMQAALGWDLRYAFQNTFRIFAVRSNQIAFFSKVKESRNDTDESTEVP